MPVMGEYGKRRHPTGPESVGGFAGRGVISDRIRALPADVAASRDGGGEREHNDRAMNP